MQTSIIMRKSAHSFLLSLLLSTPLYAVNDEDKHPSNPPSEKKETRTKQASHAGQKRSAAAMDATRDKGKEKVKEEGGQNESSAMPELKRHKVEKSENTEMLAFVGTFPEEKSQSQPIAAEDTPCLSLHTIPTCYEFSNMIAEANNGNKLAQETIISACYGGIFPGFLFDRILFDQWSLDYESWLSEDLRRVAVIVEGSPETFFKKFKLKPSHLMNQIQEKALHLRDPEAIICLSAIYGLSPSMHEISEHVAAVSNENEVYEKINTILRPLYDEGHLKATTLLAKVLSQLDEDWDDSENLRRDVVNAYHRAADAGHIPSLLKLAVCIKEGWDAEVNDPDTKLQTAISLCTRAAEAGYADAMYELGKIYQYKSRCDEKKTSDLSAEEHANLNKAIYWYKRAVSRGHRDSMTKLGLLYKKGKGIDHEDRSFFKHKARQLFMEAMNLGDHAAMYWLICMHEKFDRSGASTASSVQELTNLYKKALAHFPSGLIVTDDYKIDSDRYKLNLASLYTSGRAEAGNADQTLRAAVQLLTPLAMRKEPEALFELINLHMRGNRAGGAVHAHILYRDDSEAYWWASHFGHPNNIKIYFEPVAQAPCAQIVEEMNEFRAKLAQGLTENPSSALSTAPEGEFSDARLVDPFPAFSGQDESDDSITSLLQQTLDLTHKLEQPGVMFNIVQRRGNAAPMAVSYLNQQPRFWESRFSLETDQHIFSSLGVENVKVAREIEDMMSKQHPLWRRAQGQVDRLKTINRMTYNELHAKYMAASSLLKSVHTEEEAMKNLSLRGAEEEKQLEILAGEKLRYTAEMNRCAQQAEILKKKLEHINFVENLPDHLKAAVIKHAGVRNHLFKEQNSWADQLNE